MGRYDIAQVCMNGHVISAEVGTNPRSKQPHCDKCGAETITECLNCGTAIRGLYDTQTWGSGSRTYLPPSYCYQCGKPFPWIEKRIRAAVELSKDAGLSTEELSEFEKSLYDVTSDTPSTQVSASRIKKLLSKVSSETATGIREIIVDILSTTAKKMILD